MVAVLNVGSDRMSFRMSFGTRTAASSRVGPTHIGVNWDLGVRVEVAIIDGCVWWLSTGILECASK